MCICDKYFNSKGEEHITKLILSIFLFVLSLYANNENSVTIISYHEITDHGSDLDKMYVVNPKEFEKQIKYFKENRYNFISVDDLINNNFKKNSILITLDDGYKSVYTNAYPIFKREKIPFLVAIVGAWENETNTTLRIGDEIVKRDLFLSRDDIKEMEKSGLLEIASHSYDQHHYVAGDQYNDMEPAMVTREYKNGVYESQMDYEIRVKEDFRKNDEYIKKITGKSARVIVYPYGAYNHIAEKLAKQLHLNIGLTLEDGGNFKGIDKGRLRRILVEKTDTVEDIKAEIKRRNVDFLENEEKRGLYIDLKDVYSDNKQTEAANINTIIETIKKQNFDTVFIKPYEKKENIITETYFENEYIHVKEDLLKHISWVLKDTGSVDYVFVYINTKECGELSEQEIIDMYSQIGKNSTIDGIRFEGEKGRKEIYKNLKRYQPTLKISKCSSN